jgi:hypothetical protein
MWNGFQRQAARAVCGHTASIRALALALAMVLCAAVHAQPGCTIDVALLGAESSPGRLDQLATAIKTDPRIDTVTTFQIDTMTPTVQDLLRFDAVMVWTNDTVADSTALGDNLADYVDLGGGVVVGMWVFAAPQQSQSIAGRFLLENYFGIMRFPGSRVSGRATLGTVHDPAHPVMENVATFDGGPSSFRTNAPTHPNASRIADWNTGEPLVVVRDDLLGGRVDLGLWPVSSASASNGWDITTDGWKLLSNALHHASACSRAKGFTVCTGPIASSALPDPNIGCVPIRAGSDTPDDWAVAIPFSSGTGGAITNVTLWGVYQKTTVPTTQGFRVEFWRLNNDDVPVHEKVHTAFASVVPIDTDIKQTVSGSPVPIYEFQLVLDPPLETTANEPLRMSIVPEGERPRLCLQLARTTGSHLRLHDDGTVTSQAGTLAYSICRPGGAVGCFRFGSALQVSTGTNRFRGLGVSFLFDEHLNELNAELSLSQPTQLHWLIFESDSRTGEYTLIHESVTTPSGNGQAQYSSGPIDVLMRQGKFYLAGFAWGNETVTYYRDRAPGGIPHPWLMGTMQFAYGLNSFQLPIAGPIVFDPNKLDPFSEYDITMCFGGASQCMCDVFDTTTGLGVCDLFDIIGFQAALGSGDPAACDLDTSTGPGVCDAFDFLAFQAAFSRGCP